MFVKKAIKKSKGLLKTCAVSEIEHFPAKQYEGNHRVQRG